MTTEKVIAKLEFLGMHKLIEIPPSAENYKIALPLHVDTASIVHKRTGKELITELVRYVSLVFTAENNSQYGLQGEPEKCFVFDYVTMK